ncbi:hypothetical protein AN641_09745 [Candidatus Epulonipiscioides gigas]|nr:hypothetical protein AN641_09745 [Epulopiscium sp. SCG-C07WGA-EpuloA2]
MFENILSELEKIEQQMQDEDTVTAPQPEHQKPAEQSTNKTDLKVENVITETKKTTDVKSEIEPIVTLENNLKNIPTLHGICR